jgi:hypothetical protein
MNIFVILESSVNTLKNIFLEILTTGKTNKIYLLFCAGTVVQRRSQKSPSGANAFGRGAFFALPVQRRTVASLPGAS